MDNPIWGILTIVFAAAFYLLSYHYQNKNSYFIAVLLLMLSGLILRVFTACDFFLHPWDEVYHAVVAKHMMLHPFMPTLYENPVLPYDYQNWSGNHIWVHKQPLPLWSMALSMSIFGVNEIALRLPSIILTTLGIALTYYIGKYFFDRRTGYLAAFFYSINGLIIEMTAGRVPTDHIDVFFLFFIELAVFFSIVFSQKKSVIYNLLAGLSIGAAILCKWLPALIVLPVWLLIVIDSKQFSTKAIIIHFIILIATAVLIFLPWQIYIYQAFPIEANWEGSYNVRHLTESIESHSEPFYFYLNKLRINYGELVYIPLSWFFWLTLRGIKNLRSIALTIWLIVPIAFFSVITTKMQGYILFTSPTIFIISAFFFFVLMDNLYSVVAKRSIIRWLTVVIMILLIGLPIRYSIERIKPIQINRHPQWVSDLKELNKRNFQKAILFNCERPVDAMFYTNLTVYPNIPDKNVILDLQKNGYSILINDNGKVSDDLFQIHGINRLHLSQ